MHAVKGILDAIVGGLLTLSGLALVVLEVLILIGVVQVPTGGTCYKKQTFGISSYYSLIGQDG